MVGFLHLKNIARVRPFLPRDGAETLIHAFTMCGLDYCSALLSGLPKDSNHKLLNSAACLSTHTHKRANITPVLRSLHWLPVSYRISFRLLILFFKCLNGLGGPSIYQIFLNHPELSDPKILLSIPAITTKTHDEASVQYLGPYHWNNLPEDLGYCIIGYFYM